ncbi:bifunctional hydroxymethylpyrimidine kinase/phosphomethylpyrimidine kinase [Ectothiorhodospiraceae bacterium WFHF3C12]|nr:bifunctional hydroxymethylpyrimidine kinase/phosphomethylpyrimidine kinase [Ectothiorhodospiraceae bacterium WFHF3C12]
MRQGRVLIVAGSDSGGGAGIQADIKTVTALQGYAATAVTALTAQNTLGVEGIHGVPEAFIREQMRVVLDDIGADAVKTGMLHSTAVVECVCETLDAYAPDVPLVADPVMVAQSGDRLLVEEAVEAIRDRLLPRAALITPNVPEAQVLTGREIREVADMDAAAESLLALGAGAVLLKGGHLAGEDVTDVLATAQGLRHFVNPRVNTRNDHGTGCTLASAIATGIGQGLSLEQAVARGRAYLQRALETARPLGAGHGPVNHAHTVHTFTVSGVH